MDDKLDQPLKKDFKKNATETISRIHLEDFEVDNTLGLTENNYITGGMGYAGTMVEQEKKQSWLLQILLELLTERRMEMGFIWHIPMEV